MQHDHALKKLNFDLIPRAGDGGLVGAGLPGLRRNKCYHVATFVIPFDMHHDHVLKKLNFDLLTSPPGSGMGVGGGLQAK